MATAPSPGIAPALSKIGPDEAAAARAVAAATPASIAPVDPKAARRVDGELYELNMLASALRFAVLGIGVCAEDGAVTQDDIAGPEFLADEIAQRISRLRNDFDFRTTEKIDPAEGVHHG